MIVSCTNCDSKYSVKDSKVKGKRFGFVCPKCGNNVEVDNREEKEELGTELLEETLDTEETMQGQPDEKEQEMGMDLPEEESIQDGNNILDNIEQDFEDHSIAADLDELEKPGDGLPEDETFSVDEMDLPDLESLGEISESGETADDAINSQKEEISDDELLQSNEDILDIDIESPEEFEETDLEKDLKEMDIMPEEGSSQILEDFSPIEEEEPIEENLLEEPVSFEEIANEPDDIVNMDEVKSNEIFSHETGQEDEDEDITIDLDSLDIQLEDDEEAGTDEGMEIEEISESVGPSAMESTEIIDLNSKEEESIEPAETAETTQEEDEDITLDLDELDLTLDEVEELKEGELLQDDDERISLSDAGLTPDELVEEDETTPAHEAEDEDIRLSIDEVAPEASKEPLVDEKPHVDIEEEELPEIDLDEFEEEGAEFETLDTGPAPVEEELEDIHRRRDFIEHEEEISSLDIDIRDTVPGGMINFSIDYSLKFSRLGAFFRLIGLYLLIMIPHLVVLFIYFILSSILSVFNRIIILFTGMHEEDFTGIQENTIRYLLSLGACAADIVEDMPRFAGRKDIDYPFQYDVTYPVTYSRILAFLRLTVIGILIAALPHIILLVILSMGSVLIYLAGLISIIIRRRWPKVLFDFMIRYYRYAANVLSYITGVIDRYPSFKFE